MGKQTLISIKKVSYSSYFVYIILISLAIISILGLEYIQGQKEALNQTKEEKTIPHPKIPLEEDILDKLNQTGIPSESINQYKDERGISHILVELSPTQFKGLKPLLEKKLEEEGATILHEEKQVAKNKTFHLWKIKSKKKQQLIILFSFPRKKLPSSQPETLQPEPKVCIIIDDLGYNLNTIHEICNLHTPLTVSILPFSPLAKETASIAHKNNLEVILHLPLESINEQEEDNHMKGIIHSRMNKQEIIRKVEDCLNQIPYIQGANNHMGSKITPNKLIMHTILGCLKEKNLYFIDSMTTGNSVAYQVAQSLQIPSSYRHVFLDTKLNKEFIKTKLLELFSLAQKNGAAVGIGHPFKQTLDVLRENLYLTEEYHIVPVYASQIVK